MTRPGLLVACAAALLLAAPALAVTGGAPDGSAHPAVGLLLADRGNGPEPDCSGSLVSATVFVTAAHCTGELASDRVWVSFDSTYAAGTSALLAGTAHTDPLWGLVKDDPHDVAVVVLDRPVRGITPLRLPTAGFLTRSGAAGQPFVNVGYGFSDRTFTFDGVRRTSVSSFTTLKPTVVQLSNSDGGVCFGDSGGPRLVGDVVAAITSSGNKNCTGQSTSYRLDTASTRLFLQQFVALP